MVLFFDAFAVVVARLEDTIVIVVKSVSPTRYKLPLLLSWVTCVTDVFSLDNFAIVVALVRDFFMERISLLLVTKGEQNSAAFCQEAGNYMRKGSQRVLVCREGGGLIWINRRECKVVLDVEHQLSFRSILHPYVKSGPPPTRWPTRAAVSFSMGVLLSL